MYNENIKNSNKFNNFEKVMSHPNLTRYDYEFINE